MPFRNIFRPLPFRAKHLELLWFRFQAPAPSASYLIRHDFDHERPFPDQVSALFPTPDGFLYENFV